MYDSKNIFIKFPIFHRQYSGADLWARAGWRPSVWSTDDSHNEGTSPCHGCSIARSKTFVQTGPCRTSKEWNSLPFKILNSPDFYKPFTFVRQCFSQQKQCEPGRGRPFLQLFRKSGPLCHLPCKAPNSPFFGLIFHFSFIKMSYCDIYFQVFQGLFYRFMSMSVSVWLHMHMC